LGATCGGHFPDGKAAATRIRPANIVRSNPIAEKPRDKLIRYRLVRVDPRRMSPLTGFMTRHDASPPSNATVRVEK
jgi:hypothetical protein